MTIYLVVRMGVYMQGIVGVFSDERRAQLALDKAKDKEPDSYHTFKIEPFTLDIFREEYY